MRLRRVALLLVAAAAVGSGLPLTAGEVPKSAATREIVAAHDRARESFKARRDPSEAISILERAQVEALLVSPPEDLPRDRYAEIFEDYSKYLRGAADPGKRERGYVLAASLPALFRARAQAHLDAGDAAMAEHARSGARGELRAAKESYARYLSWLAKAAAHAPGQDRYPGVIPERVSDLVYGGSTRSVCELMAWLLKESRDDDLSLFLNPERESGSFTPGQMDRYGRPADVSELDPATLRWLSDEAGRQGLNVSRVDMDGDGVEEFRFSTRVGTASCERNHLLRRTATGSYQRLEGPVWDGINGQEGARCGGDYLAFIRHKGRNLLVDTAEGWPRDRQEVMRTILSATGDRITKLCSITRRPGPLKVRTDCPHRACRLVAREAVRIVTGIRGCCPDGGESVAGPEAAGLTSERLSPAARQVLSKRSFEGWTRIDLDNDGAPEVIAWTRWGRGDVLDYTVFKRGGDGLFQIVDPGKVWPLWTRIAGRYEDFYWDEGMEFRRFAGKNYVVTVRGAKEKALRGRGYDVRIFLLEKTSGREIGTVHAVSDWVVTVEGSAK